MVAAGVARAQVNVRAGSGGTSTATAATRNDDPGLWESLKDLFIPDNDRATYAEGLRRGGFLVTAQVGDAQYDKALDILDADGTVNLDERAATWRKEGWTGDAGGATGGALGAATAGGATVARGATANTLGEGREEVIALTEEQIRVGKREVEHGRVRVRSYVVETPVQEQIGLRQEHVSIERRPVDRAATDADLLFKDRTIEATETAEEGVISKDVRVKEELVLRKDTGQRTQTVTDTVRRTEVEVEDERVATGAGASTKTDRKVS